MDSSLFPLGIGMSSLIGHMKSTYFFYSQIKKKHIAGTEHIMSTFYKVFFK